MEQNQKKKEVGLSEKKAPLKSPPGKRAATRPSSEKNKRKRKKKNSGSPLLFPKGGKENSPEKKHLNLDRS